MSKFIYYPVKDPINKSNLFGANSAEYIPLGNAGHPGNDFESVSGTPLYSPCDGLAFYLSDKLGGDGLWIRTTQAGQNYNIILWHLYAKGDPVHSFQIPTDGSHTAVKAGQLLAYTDNSGFPRESTGPHLHLAAMPCDPDWNPLHPNNGYQGCIDPMPFYLGQYAEDIPLLEQALEKSDQVIQKIVSAPLDNSVKVSFLKQLAILISGFFKGQK